MQSTPGLTGFGDQQTPCRRVLLLGGLSQCQYIPVSGCKNIPVSGCKYIPNPARCEVCYCLLAHHEALEIGLRRQGCQSVGCLRFTRHVRVLHN